MILTKKQLATYKGLNRSNIAKHYQTYIDILELKRDYITLFDVAKVDDVDPEFVYLMAEINDHKVLKCIKMTRNYRK